MELAAEEEQRSGVTVDGDGEAERSRSLIFFSFPYPTGATEGTHADTVIKKRVAQCRGLLAGHICTKGASVRTDTLHLAFKRIRSIYKMMNDKTNNNICMPCNFLYIN